MEKKTLYLIYVIIVLPLLLHAETQKTILQYLPYAVTYMITYIQSTIVKQPNA